MTNVQIVSELLKPYDAASMRSYPVSNRINRVSTTTRSARDVFCYRGAESPVPVVSRAR
jgi:putative SOS response-associated peptidase YedK